MAEEFKITDWLAKAKEDPKVAAQPLLIAAAVLFGGYKGLYAPKVVELAKELKKNTALETKIKTVEEAIENIEDIKLDIEEKKSTFSKATALCYRKSEMTNYLRRIRELAQKAGIDVKSVNPQALTPLSIGTISLEKCPVSFFFSGDLVKLGTFLRLVEMEDKITFLEMPPLTPNASGTFEMDLSPATILIPDNMLVTP